LAGTPAILVSPAPTVPSTRVDPVRKRHVRARPGRTMLSTVNRWFSGRALLLHVEFWLVVAACGAATWWQASRALSGNGLSWFYTFEWPIFAGIAVAAWWHLIHENPEERAARKRQRAALDPAERKAEW
jgi:hypothetical protein